MRLALNNLLPGAPYAIQVRAKNSEGTSEWSRRVVFTTISDDVLPSSPLNVTWTVAGSGFHAEWDAVTTNVNGDTIPVTRYEVQMVSSGTTKVISVPQATGTKNSFDLSFEQNIALFGTARPSITISVRAVDNKELKSAWSSSVSATNPAPSAPSGLTATAGANSIVLSWAANAVDNDIVSYNIYQGASANPTTKVANVSGNTWTAVVTNTTPQYFVVKAVDVFGTEGTFGATAGPTTARNPVIVDTTAPTVPTSLVANITNNTNGIGARAAVGWVNGSDTDRAGTEIQYKKNSESSWTSVLVGKDAGSTNIDLSSAYTAYDFRIRAYDWANNYSAWSSTLAKAAVANTAPSNVSGLTSTVSKDAIRYSWTAVSDADLREYEVTFATSSDFTANPQTFRTGNANYLTVSGLNSSTTYYARVRAVDNGGLSSASWSAPNTSTTLSYSANTSDGVAPSTSPTPSVMSGIGYLSVSWSPVTNNDFVTYEVHVSPTSGFTPSASTKVADTASTLQIVRTLNGGSALSYGTTYYVRIIARDADGAAAPGAQASGSPQQALIGDINITPADIGAPSNTQFNNLTTIVNDSIKSTVNEYAVNSSETVAPTTGWSTATPTRNPGTFVWYRTVVTYNNNNTTTTSPALLTGNTGATGSTGNGIASTAITYQVGSSGTSAPTGAWQTTPQATNVGQFLWTRTITTYTDSTTSTSYSVSAHGATGSQGNPGNPGSNGISITSVTPYYQQTTAGSAAPATPTTNPPASPWVSTEPGYAANTELWRTELITYSDSTFAYTAVNKVSSYTAAIAAMTAANTAQSTADGKNKTTYSNISPGSAANNAGDIWWRTSGNLITEQWSGLGGTSWEQKTLDNAVIANLDAGKLNAGIISTDRLGARSITVEKLVIGDTTNMITDPRFDYNGTHWQYSGTDASFVTVTDSARATKAAKIPGRGNGTYPALLARDYLPVVPGQIYYGEAEGMRGASGSASLRARWYKKDYTPTSTSNSAIAGVPGTTWSTFGGQVTAPTDAAYVKIWMEYANGNVGDDAYFTDISFKPAVTGKLVVNGSLLISSVSNLQSSLDSKETPAGAQAKANAAQAIAVGSNYLNLNPTFSDWTTTYPNGIYGWGGDAPTKNTSITRTGQWSMQFNATGTADQGVGIGGTLNGYLPYEEYVFVEVDVYLVSGNFSGSGILLDWTGAAAPNRAFVNFHTLEPNPTVGRWYRMGQVIKRPTATGTWTSWTAYFMANYASGLSPKTIKNLLVDRIGFRPATVEEITAFNAPGNLSTRATQLEAYANTAAGNAQTGAINNIRTLWGASANTTLIDGGKLYNSSVTTSAIAVGDFNNYAGDGAFLYDKGWNFDAQAVRTVTTSEPNYITLTKVVTGNKDTYSANWFEVIPGDTYYVYGEVYKPTNNPTTAVAAGETLRVGLNFMTAANVNNWQGVNYNAADVDANANGVWKSFSGVAVVPASMVRGRVWISIGGGTASNNSYRFRNIRVLRRNGGELIVDGSIAANKITAGTYTGGEFIIGSGGVLRTANSAVIITDQGITITAAGTVNAGALQSNTTITATGLSLTGNITMNTTSGYIRGGGYTGTDATTNPSGTGWFLGQGGLHIDNGIIDASAVRSGNLGGPSGTNSVINVTTGTSLVLNGGYLKSNTYTGTSYNATAGAGFYLGDDGLRIASGSVSASAITAGTISGTNTITLSGANAKIVGTGFELSGSGLVVTSGSVAAAALQIQSSPNMMPYAESTFDVPLSSINYSTSGEVSVSLDSDYAIPTIGNNLGQSLRLTKTGTSAASVLLSSSSSDYNIHQPQGPGSYIFSIYVKSVSGSNNVGDWVFEVFRGLAGNSAATKMASITHTSAFSTTGWTRVSGSFTGANPSTNYRVEIKGPLSDSTILIDCVQIERKIGALNTPSPYQIPGLTSVDGSMIKTGEIRSTNNTTINGVQEPIWSIPKNGVATFAGMRVLGNTVLGNSGLDSDSMLTSANYTPGSAGWRIIANGDAEFNNVTVRGNIQGNSNSVFNGGTVTGATVTGGVVQTGASNIGTVRLSSTGDNGFLAYREDGQIGVRIPRTGLFQGSLVVDWGGLIINSPNNFINNGGTLWALGQEASSAGVYTSLSGGILKTGTWLGGSGFNTGYPEIVTSPTEIRFRASASNGGQAGYSSNTNSTYLDSLQNVFIRAQSGTAEVVSNDGMARVTGINATITSSSTTTVYSGDTITIQSNNSSGGATAIWLRAPNGGGIILGENTTASGSILSPKIMNTTTPNAANVNISGSGVMARSTSSRRYKADIKPATIDSYKILDIEPATWLDKPELAAWDERPETMPKRYFGAVAEQVDEAGLQELVVYENNRPEALAYDRMFVYALPMIKDMNERLTASEQENASLREELDEMKTLLTELKKLLPGS